MVVNDNQDLRKKVYEMQSREIQLIETINKLKKEVEKKSGTTDIVSKEERMFQDKMQVMKSEYEKVIKDLSKKISVLQTKEVNLKMIDSNVGSDLLDPQELENRDFQDIDSEIDFDIDDINSN